jgi:hypothetical protein
MKRPDWCRRGAAAVGAQHRGVCALLDDAAVAE